LTHTVGEMTVLQVGNSLLHKHGSYKYKYQYFLRLPTSIGVMSVYCSPLLMMFIIMGDNVITIKGDDAHQQLLYS